jgi:hypothetical protein
VTWWMRLFLIATVFALGALAGSMWPLPVGSQHNVTVAAPAATVTRTPLPVNADGLCLDPTTGAFTSSACQWIFAGGQP